MAQLSNIPEFLMCDMINRAFDFIRADLTANNADTTKSLLYAMTNGPTLERTDFFKEISAILSKGKNEKRFLECELMFNMKAETPPNIYITLPAEQPGQNGMGLDEGYSDPVIIEDPDTFQGTWQPTFTRRKNVNYNFVITSDNSNETVVLYHFIQALLLSLSTSFDLAGGFQNQRVGGGEVRPYAELVPKNIFTRVVSLYFEYEISSIDFSKYPLINQVVIIGKPVAEIIKPV